MYVYVYIYIIYVYIYTFPWIFPWIFPPKVAFVWGEASPLAKHSTCCEPKISQVLLSLSAVQDPPGQFSTSQNDGHIQYLLIVNKYIYFRYTYIYIYHTYMYIYIYIHIRYIRTHEISRPSFQRVVQIAIGRHVPPMFLSETSGGRWPWKLHSPAHMDRLQAGWWKSGLFACERCQNAKTQENYWN